MTITLIEDSNKKIKGSKAKEVKIDLLTSEERQAITNILEEIRQEAIYYDKYKEETEQTGKYDNFELAGIFFTFLEYNQQVVRIKEIFTNIKKRVGEQKEVELLEQSVLRILEKLTEGVDYWEDLELREYSWWLWKELKNSWSAEDTHIEVMHDISKMAKEQNDKETKELREEIEEKAQKLESASERIAKLEAQVEKLEEESKQKTEKIEKISEQLTKSESQNEEWERLFDLNNKILSTLPKEKDNKTSSTKQKIFKWIKAKAKAKIQQLNKIKKRKSQNQEMIASIEVKSK